MQPTPIADAAVAGMPTPPVYPMQFGPEYLRDGAVTEYPAANLCPANPAVAATEPPHATAGSSAASAVAAQASGPQSHQSFILPTQASGSAVAAQPSGSGQPSVTDLPVDPSAQASGQQRIPQSRRQPIDGHAAKNQDFEVGNFNLFFGNWGSRSLQHNMRGNAGRVHSNINRQISKCPCIVVTLAEATEECASDLRRGFYNNGGIAPNDLDDRKSHEHFVHRSRGVDVGVLIACRTDNTTELTLLEDEVHTDAVYREKGQSKPALTKTLICEVCFKQNVGHLGTKIPICVCHLSNRTAKGEFAECVLSDFWDKIAAWSRKFGLKFLTGDFNMSFLQVCDQLRSRGLRIDCAAWYPWCERSAAPRTGGPVGIDSCGIFYIGGDVNVTLPWNLSHLDTIEAAVAGNTDLDVYEGNNPPGQNWSCYIPKKRTLRQHLESFLLPSTTAYELSCIQKKNCYCPYLRLKQKNVRMDYWLYNGNRHNGAHYPLACYTHNASARSADREDARRMERKLKKKSHETPEVADPAP